MGTTPATRPTDSYFGESVNVRQRGWLRRALAFVGPAYLVSVGYMDPGNWATDIEGGARFGYSLIWVLLMSNLMAVLLQTLAARLGIVTGLDLAQGCRREYPRALGLFLWALSEIAIAATDLAEALGTIIGLNLLFGLPLLWGCAVTAFDTVLLLGLLKLGVRKMEAFIVMLVATIGGCFVLEVFLAHPQWHGIIAGFRPRLEAGSLYVAIGMIGATVMPHNLYLHSCLVQSRRISRTFVGRAQACKYNLVDSMLALNLAFFVNAAILIVAAATFYSRGIVVTEIQQAHQLLQPILGARVAPIVFAVALLAAGQSSTLTGTIAGQVVMEGFLNIRVRPWLRRLLTRGVALAPAVVVIALAGEQGTYRLLIFSQVILSLQLPFAVIPLIHFTSDKHKMGPFASGPVVRVFAWIVAAIIVALNVKLVVDTLGGWFASLPWLWLPLGPVLVLLVAALGYICLAPLLRKSKPWVTPEMEAHTEIGPHIKPLTIKHIGVALEHTFGDARIVSAALTLANSHKAVLTLVHVVETPGTAVYGGDSASLHGQTDHQYLEHLAQEIEERGYAVDVDLRYGNPAEQVIRAVHDGEFDLLVLGSHGHRGFADLVYGQTVDSVRHAIDIPVFVVRSADKERPQEPNSSRPTAS
jgi:manganese transport protein